MPVPWKKSSKKINCVSKFVSELRATSSFSSSSSSSKGRGESPLLLQTGFPTSIIHLIAKNQHRFNQSSSSPSSSSTSTSTSTSTSKSKKNKHRNRHDVLYSDPNNSNQCRQLLLPAIAPSMHQQVNNAINLDVVNESQDEAMEQGVEVSPTLNNLFISFIIIFALLTLVVDVGVKNLTIGITFIATFLFLFEYYGEALLYNDACKDRLQFLFGSLRFQKLDSSFRVQGPTCLSLSLSNSSKSSSIEDDAESSIFERVQHQDHLHNDDDDDLVYDDDGDCDYDNGHVVREMQVVKPDLDLLIDNARIREFFDAIDRRIVSRMNEEEFAALDKARRTKSAKIKAKLLRKFVVKKFRGTCSKCTTKTDKDVKEVFQEDRRNFFTNCAAEEVKLIEGREEEEDDEYGYGYGYGYGYEDDDVDDDEHEEVWREEEITEDFDGSKSSNSSEVSFDMVVGENVGSKQQCNSELGEDVGRKPQCNSELEENVGGKPKRYSELFIAFMIILIGLLGGRIVALVLTVGSCLLVKQPKLPTESREMIMVHYS